MKKQNYFCLQMTCFYIKSLKFPQQSIRINDSIKFQDSKLMYKSQLYFYILTINYQKNKFKKQSQ